MVAYSGLAFWLILLWPKLATAQTISPERIQQVADEVTRLFQQVQVYSVAIIIITFLTAAACLFVIRWIGGAWVRQGWIQVALCIIIPWIVFGVSTSVVMDQFSTAKCSESEGYALGCFATKAELTQAADHPSLDDVERGNIAFLNSRSGSSSSPIWLLEPLALLIGILGVPALVIGTLLVSHRNMVRAKN